LSTLPGLWLQRDKGRTRLLPQVHTEFFSPPVQPLGWAYLVGALNPNLCPDLVLPQLYRALVFCPHVTGFTYTTLQLQGTHLCTFQEVTKWVGDFSLQLPTIQLRGAQQTDAPGRRAVGHVRCGGILPLPLSFAG
jgi:hypothetical protein